MAEMDNALLVVLALCSSPTGEFGLAPVLADAWQRAFDRDLLDVIEDPEEPDGEFIFLTAEGWTLFSETLGLDVPSLLD